MRIGTMAALCLVLAGCSTGFEDIGSLYVAPGKFDYLDCASIAQRSEAASKREQELTSLMERAKQGTGGSLVNALVYSDELKTVRAELLLLHKTSAEKKCTNS
ncbi:MAG TPA: hypothetical protein VHA77_06165 [Xanthobacteraceae bacterium]|jgi:hypothetical protein|nr:hypothetical protein [Xanthobacteraceae bacterium]